MRIPDEHDFSSRLRSPAVSARVGLWLGVCFGFAFVTGVISHYAQVPDPWLPFPTSPSWGYRVTQGVHVVAGTAAVPLLLVKLYAVFPKLFARPPRAVRELALHAAERGSIAVLVAAAIFQLASGLANSAQWYPWGFHFRQTHYAVGWIAIGALVVHVGVKLPLVSSALRSDVESGVLDRPGTAAASRGLSRRGLLRTTWAATGVAVLATAGSTFPWLRRISVLGVRSGEGPAGIPINRSAKAAAVIAAATSVAYRLEVVYADRTVTLSRAQLEVLPQVTATLPIACVEGWSASGTWTGVRIRDLLDLVGAPPTSTVRVESLEFDGGYYASLPGNFTDDPRTLIALGLNGGPLAIDHGYPCRVIAPNRPGVLQVKWLRRIEVMA